MGIISWDFVAEALVSELDSRDWEWNPKWKDSYGNLHQFYTDYLWHLGTEVWVDSDETPNYYVSNMFTNWYIVDESEDAETYWHHVDNDTYEYCDWAMWIMLCF